MKKIINYIFLAVFIMFITNSNVIALECDYKQKAELSKMASKVTAAYELKSENNQEYFEITIRNILDTLYVSVTSESKSESAPSFYEGMITNADTVDGNYTFKVYDTENIITYKISVSAYNSPCTNLYNFKLVKPKRNEFFYQDICKYEEVIDYYYCQEWIETPFKIKDTEIYSRIEAERNNKKKTTKSVCIDCENQKENENKKDNKELIKRYLIMGICIAIVVDLFSIVLMIRNIRRSSI